MSPGRQTSFPVSPPPGTLKPSGILFLFSHETEVLHGKFAGEASVLRGTALLFRWTKAVAPPARVMVYHRGADATLLSTRWLPSTSAKTIDKLLASVVAPEDVFAERRRRLEKLPPSLARTQALAWCTFDQLTDPSELERRGALEPAADIRVLTQFLVMRVLQRASWALDYRAFEPQVELDERHRTRAIGVEAVFRRALIRAFPRPNAADKLDLPAFEAAFAAFVAGELALEKLAPLKPPQTPDPMTYHGAPDGSKFLCFAEAALYFLRMRLQPAFWLVLLRSFACGAAVFTSGYWDGIRRTLPGYSWSFRGELPTSRTVLATLRQRYGAMVLPELAHDFSCTVAFALAKDPSISRPVPTPLEMR